MSRLDLVGPMDVENRSWVASPGVATVARRSCIARACVSLLCQTPRTTAVMYGAAHSVARLTVARVWAATTIHEFNVTYNKYQV